MVKDLDMTILCKTDQHFLTFLHMKTKTRKRNKDCNFILKKVKIMAEEKRPATMLG